MNHISQATGDTTSDATMNNCTSRAGWKATAEVIADIIDATKQVWDSNAADPYDATSEFTSSL